MTMDFIDGSLEAEGHHGHAGNQNAIISIPLPVFVTITGMKVTGKFFQLILYYVSLTSKLVGVGFQFFSFISFPVHLPYIFSKANTKCLALH